MVIQGIGRVAVPDAGRGRAGVGRPGFAVAANPAARTAALSAPTALDGLLLLQEVEDAPERDRRARKHGRAMLDALGRLQLSLLGGDPATNDLHRLAALAEHCPEAADPVLRGLLGAVALRAQVELARHNM